MSTLELGCWCRCKLPRGVAVCALERGCWCRCRLQGPLPGVWPCALGCWCAADRCVAVCAWVLVRRCQMCGCALWSLGAGGAAGRRYQMCGSVRLGARAAAGSRCWMAPLEGAHKVIFAIWGLCGRNLVDDFGADQDNSSKVNWLTVFHRRLWALQCCALWVTDTCFPF